MKTCSRCRLELPIDKFSINRSRPDGRCASCRECHSLYTKNHYDKNKEYYKAKAGKYGKSLNNWIDSLKTGPCADCGLRFNPWQMDFDHILGKKLFSIGVARSRMMSKKVILEEIKKCELVCANCHRQRTYLRTIASSGGSWRNSTKVAIDCSIQS